MWHDNRRKATFQSWSDMKQRCYNTKSQQFRNYGARGIIVCERWLESFDNFLCDMGEKPEGMTIDRIDVNGNYEKENCRWADAKTQRRNRRRFELQELDGEKLTLEGWASRTGVHYTTIAWRLKVGWPKRLALTTGKTSGAFGKKLKAARKESK